MLDLVHSKCSVNARLRSIAINGMVWRVPARVPHVSSPPFLSTHQVGFSLSRVRSGSVRSYPVSAGSGKGVRTHRAGVGRLSVFCTQNTKTLFFPRGGSKKRPWVVGWERRATLGSLCLFRRSRIHMNAFCREIAAASWSCSSSTPSCCSEWGLGLGHTHGHVSQGVVPTGQVE